MIAQRWHFVDVLRAAMMLVGIPVHVLSYFRDDLGVLDHLIWFSMSWRMPTFFVVAGFFAFVMAQRRGPRWWLRNRVVRLGVPLAFFALVVNWVVLIRLVGPEAALERRSTMLWPWVLHSWFLLYLLAYCVIFAAAVLLFRRLPAGLRASSARGATAMLSSGWTVLASALALGVLALGVSTPWQAFGEANWWLSAPPLRYLEFWEYLICFGAGVALAVATRASGATDGLGVVVRRISGWPVLVAAVLGTTLLLAVKHDVAWVTAFWGPLPGITVGTTVALLWAALLLRFFQRHCNWDSPAVRWLVDASLPVYLVHYVLVHLAGPWMRDAGWSGLGGFLVLGFVVLLGSVLVHELANCWLPTRVLLSGSPRRAVSLVDVLRGSGTPARAGRGGVRGRVGGVPSDSRAPGSAGGQVAGQFEEQRCHEGDRQGHRDDQQGLAEDVRPRGRHVGRHRSGV